MTINSSKQTTILKKGDWLVIKPRDYQAPPFHGQSTTTESLRDLARSHQRNDLELPRPVVPISREFAPLALIEKHSHQWGQLVYSSRGVMQIETVEGVFVIPPQQALWLPPHVEHTHYCRHGASYRSLHIAAELCEELGSQVFTLDVDALLKELILEVCCWPKDYQITAQKQRLLQVLLDRLAQASDNGLFMPTISDKRLLPIIEALNHDLSNKLTIEQWASQVGASSRTLNRLFNQYFGFGFSRWKQKLRILKSLEMLSDDNSSSEIAFALGYESSSAFISAFTKQMGCSPKRYKDNRPESATN